MRGFRKLLFGSGVAELSKLCSEEAGSQRLETSATSLPPPSIRRFRMFSKKTRSVHFLLALALGASSAFGEPDSVGGHGFADRERAAERYPDLSQALENPLARVLSIPLKFSFEKGGGIAGDGQLSTTRFNPRIPIHINDDLHIISHSTFSWVSQSDRIAPGRGEGFTDLFQSFLLSPERPGFEKVYGGLGPSFLLPTASGEQPGTDKYSVGPSIALYRQARGWTAGLLLSHVWSVAGDEDAMDVSTTLIAPLVSYTLPSSTTFSMSSETAYDWSRRSWGLPLNFSVGQLVMIGKRPVKLALGTTYFAGGRDGLPEWAYNVQVTMPFRSPNWRIFRKR